MKKLLIFVVLAICCSGCFTLVEEIRHEPDNTYTISHTVSMGVSTFNKFTSLKRKAEAIEDDSLRALRRSIDSMLHEFGSGIDTLKTLPGYMSAILRDTTIDTMIYFIASARVSDAIYLPNFHKRLWNMNNDGVMKNDIFLLDVEKKNNKTYVRYVFPSKKESGIPKGFLKDLNIHFRVISPNLVIPKGKTQMKKIPGGLEYKLPLLEIVEGKKAPKSVDFVIE
jgi:hypothetical protein